MSGNPNRVVLNYHNTLLRQNDVFLLTGAHWLNDQIISFYLEYLERNIYKNRKDLLFVSPEVVQCLKFVTRQEMSIFLEPLNAHEKQFIFMPLNDNNEVTAGGNHWSLLVFSRPESTFFYYDSLIGGHSSLRSLRPFLCELSAALNCEQFDIQQGDCINQTNSYDCGVHVIVNIEILARRAIKYGLIDIHNETNQQSADYDEDDDDDDPMLITNQQIRQKRKDILKLIENLGGTL